ncbi:uncharacterized protein LOC143305696 isoform X1 [Osmia lignaria lignaria]|uniref:uncharacterized protein LOC143305696 isoform X1 n=1 Tax=Osmia lignaria lignaria TaxID=1437193 RepID=UPI00402B522D
MPLNRHLPTILKVTSSPLDRMTSGHRIRQSFDTSVCDVQRVPVDGQANVGSEVETQEYREGCLKRAVVVRLVIPVPEHYRHPGDVPRRRRISPRKIFVGRVWHRV